MTRWSYHVEAMNIPERWWRKKRQAEELTRFNQRLNNLGSAGWELVAYAATPMTGVFTQNVHYFWQDPPAPYGPLFILIAKSVAWLIGNNIILGVVLMRLALLINF